MWRGEPEGKTGAISAREGVEDCVSHCVFRGLFPFTINKLAPIRLTATTRRSAVEWSYLTQASRIWSSRNKRLTEKQVLRLPALRFGRSG